MVSLGPSLITPPLITKNHITSTDMSKPYSEKTPSGVFGGPQSNSSSLVSHLVQRWRKRVTIGIELREKNTGFLLRGLPRGSHQDAPVLSPNHLATAYIQQFALRPAGLGISRYDLLSLTSLLFPKNGPWGEEKKKHLSCIILKSRFCTNTYTLHIPMSSYPHHMLKMHDCLPPSAFLAYPI